jgi:membrane dipeptidase
MRLLIISFISIILFLKFVCFSSDSENMKKNNSDTNVKKSTIDDTSKKNFSNLIEEAFDLHYDAVVIDTHNDILMPIFLKGADISKSNPGTQSDFVKWKKGGLDVQVFSIYVPERYKSGHFKYVTKLIDKMEGYAVDHSDIFALCRSYDDVMQGIESGRFCGLMVRRGI